jgi:mycothiol system anti-sigma-R factor
MTESELPAGLIPCSQAVQQMWDYLDRALSPDELARVDRHMAFCRKCCGEMEFAKELQGVLASTGSDELPPNVRARLERFLEEM